MTLAEPSKAEAKASKVAGGADRAVPILRRVRMRERVRQYVQSANAAVLHSGYGHSPLYRGLNIYTCIHTYIRIYIHIHLYIYTYAHTHTHTHVYTYDYTYILI
jgi:hypothetical protein